MANLPFHAMRMPEVFLAPGGTSRIEASAEVLQAFVLPPELTRETLDKGAAVVYRFDGDTLRDATLRYRDMASATLPSGTPRFINIGDEIFSQYLGSGWRPAADGYRSMTGIASLRIGGGRVVYIGVVRTKPFPLRLMVDGAEVPLELVTRVDGLSLFRAAVPHAAGHPDLTLTLSTDLREPLTFGFAKSSEASQ